MFNRLFEKYGHDCEMIPEKDILLTYLPGTSLWARFNRLMHQYCTVSELHSQSKRYLRSQAAIAREKERHLKDFRYIIHPFSDVSLYWQIVMTFVFLAALIILPFTAAFLYKTNRPDWSVWIVLRNIINILCWIDICINFSTGFRDSTTKEIVLSRKKIIRDYLRSYFLIDFLSSFPSALLYGNYLDIDVSRMLAEVLSLLKIFRISTMIKYKASFVEVFKIGSIVDSIVQLFVLFMLYVHLVACYCFYVGTMRYGDTVGNNISWVSATCVNKTIMYQYAQAFFRASCFVTESGNSIPPEKLPEDILYTVFIWILSKILSIVYVARLMQVIQGLTSSRAKYQEMVRQLREYMCHKQLPQAMQRRLLQYYEFRFQKSYFRENEILNTISGQLRQEIVLHSCRQLVENVTFFNNLPLSLLVRIVSCLRSEVFLTNDVIIRANTSGDSMYFIASGTVAIFTSSGKEVCHLEDGSHFGEVALVMREERRVASVVAVEICELYRLDRKNFIRAIHPYPDLLENIEHIAAERLERTNLLDEQNKRMLAERIYKNV